MPNLTRFIAAVTLHILFQLTHWTGLLVSYRHRLQMNLFGIYGILGLPELQLHKMEKILNLFAIGFFGLLFFFNISNYGIDSTNKFI